MLKLSFLKLYFHKVKLRKLFNISKSGQKGHFSKWSKKVKNVEIGFPKALFSQSKIAEIADP